MTLGIVLCVLNIPLYVFIGRFLFGTWSEFWECVRFWLTPDIISAFRDELDVDWQAELLLALLVVVCAGIVYGEYWLIRTFVL